MHLTQGVALKHSAAPLPTRQAEPPSCSRGTTSSSVLALFDVDGTLAVARKVSISQHGHLLSQLPSTALALQKADRDMLVFLQTLRKYIKVGIVGGSDLNKICEALGANATAEFDYLFAENGLMAYKQGRLHAVQSLKKHLGEAKLKELINFILHYVADLDIPIKRGTFVEFRTGMLNVSPIGRNCSQEERDEFEQFDLQAGIRKQFISDLKARFQDFSLVYSIGGQISFDVFPVGWDKTYCLQFVEDEGFKEIHFFGDKTFKGGNDYEIFSSPGTIGHTVTSPIDTVEQCTELFIKPHASGSGSGVQAAVERVLNSES